ncbi:MAG: FAD-binding oxidoreductase [Candidatus Moranbacteria bacterium]|nr:FAD-binding oxidoreductase [Candidatus Moranbacteria bacterium]MDD3965291.1 FAD-binding oxidoreductase [Candidatus Moranbacteria bacterium]
MGFHLTSFEKELHRAFIDWQKILGKRNVLDQEQSREKYGKTTFTTTYTVLGALVCKKTADIIRVVEIAQKFNIPVYPVSGGKNWGYGNSLPPEQAVVIDLSLMKEISNFDPVLGIITLEPGVTQKDLYNFLRKKKTQFLVPVHGGGPTCSIVGNALERGFGITPYADHFSAITSLEAVLPDGSLYRRALDEMGGVEVNRLHKWGIGPYLDGLFSQGNFGIVTSMTLVLAPVPEKVELVFFRVNEEADLEKAIEALQKSLSLTGTVTGSFNIMNARRVLSMQEAYPETSTMIGSIVPQKIIDMMAHADQVTAWTGIGAIYGHKALVKGAKTILKETLSPHVSHLTFLSPALIRQASSFAKLVPGHFGRHLSGTIDSLLSLFEILHGKPNEVALPLAYWKSGVDMPTGKPLDPARDGCGLYWYSPLVPFKSSDVRACARMIQDICEKNGIEPLMTFTSLSSRCFDVTVPILFRLNDTEDAERAKRCYEELFQAGQKMGYIPYRLSLSSMHLLKDLAPSSTHLASILKTSIDPKRLIAPGRYVFPDKE